MSQFVNLKIKEVIHETPSAVSLVFDVPESLRKHFNFVPGQYITLKAEINGDEVRRAYSLSSSPEEKDIKVSVKKIADGTFSVYANEKLKAGDSIKAMFPEGKFKLHPQPNKVLNYMAFAAGSGITPIISMIKTVLSQEDRSKFVLIYGNRSNQEAMFTKELLKLQSLHPERLFIEFIYSRENADGAHFGRIDRGTVNFAIKNKFKDEDFNDFFLCGPKPMIDTVREVLAENGIEKESIHYELFTSNEIEASSNSGSTSIHVTLDDEEETIEGNKETTLLDNVLNADLDAPYSCKGGVCCSCICRVTEGKAEMKNNNLLTDSEVEEGLVLACQAYPITDTVKIDFDDA